MTYPATEIGSTAQGSQVHSPYVGLSVGNEKTRASRRGKGQRGCRDSLLGCSILERLQQGRISWNGAAADADDLELPPAAGVATKPGGRDADQAIVASTSPIR